MRIISQLAIGKAAKAWCMPETSSTVMDVKLACEFAKILDSEMWNPHLGCATTKQLFEELMSRSDLEYKTSPIMPVQEDTGRCCPALAEDKKHGE